jgi:hydroxypyruvate isomerase
VVEAVGAENLKIMFDCYHAHKTEGAVSRWLETALPHVGHIQIAGCPHRNEPDQGEVAYLPILRSLAKRGYARPIGAEYHPRGQTEDGLAWLKDWRAIQSDI